MLKISRSLHRSIIILIGSLGIFASCIDSTIKSSEISKDSISSEFFEFMVDSLFTIDIPNSYSRIHHESRKVWEFNNLFGEKHISIELIEVDDSNQDEFQKLNSIAVELTSDFLNCKDCFSISDYKSTEGAMGLMVDAEVSEFGVSEKIIYKIGYFTNKENVICIKTWSLARRKHLFLQEANSCIISYSTNV